MRRSKTFEGNVSEGSTLQGMLADLAAPVGALVIMDAGIATQANIDWLIEHKYRYLVVRRGGVREFDAQQSVSTQTVGGETVRLQKVLSADGLEVQLHCHSEGRQAKEQAMSGRFCTAFEAGLKKIADGLSKPRSEKRLDKLNEHIGRLKQRSSGVSQHYQITLTADEVGKNATALNWKQEWVSGTMATHPGVYCLRTNVLDWDAEKLWQTYSSLTDIESVFRSLKSELGLRPVFHHKENRADGHLFITVLAYQCVQLIRTELKAQATINDSWETLRQTMQVQRRTTKVEWPLLIDFALNTAARLQEILKTKWSDLNVEGRSWTIPPENVKTSTFRTVPLSKKSLAILTQMETLKVKGEERVFHMWANSATVSKGFRRLTVRAGIDDFRFHDLRHEGVSRLFETTDLTDSEIMSITGHTSSEMLKAYSALRPSALARRLDGEKR